MWHAEKEKNVCVFFKKEKQIGGRWIISLLRIIIYTRLELLFALLQIKTVKVSNVSLGATERGIKEFFSFSGDIEYVEMKRLASCLASHLLFFNLYWGIKLIIYLAVIMSGLKLRMLPSRICREQRLQFFFR